MSQIILMVDIIVKRKNFFLGFGELISGVGIIVGGGFAAAAFASETMGGSIETVLCAIYVIILVINLLADDSIANKQKWHESENDFIKGISNQIKYIQTLVSDNDAKKKLESLYYLAHSCPSKSGESMKFYENEIVRNISLLEDAANQNKITDLLSISGEIERQLNKRTFEARTRN